MPVRQCGSLQAPWSKPLHHSSPVLTAPVSAVQALFATVRARPSPFRPVKTASRRRWALLAKPPPGAAGGGFEETKRTGTRSDGRKQDRNSADGCDEDRAPDHGPAPPSLTHSPGPPGQSRMHAVDRRQEPIWPGACGAASSP